MIEKRLETALRQYRHTDNSGYVAGYDRSEALKVVADIEQENIDLRMQIIDLKASLRSCFNSAKGALDQYNTL